MQDVSRAAVSDHAVVHLHNALITLFTGHQFGNHGAILLVNSGLVGVLATDRVHPIVIAVIVILGRS